MTKSLVITIIFAVLISGIGHIYLGFLKRGIIILIIGIALWILMSWLVPIPFSWIIGISYWIWQFLDAYKHYKKLDSGQPQVEK